MNQGAKEFVKLSWLLALNPFAVASRPALACCTAFPRGRWFPPARPSEPPWEPVTAKIRDGSVRSPCLLQVDVCPSRSTHSVEVEAFFEVRKACEDYLFVCLYGSVWLTANGINSFVKNSGSRLGGACLLFCRHPSLSSNGTVS